MKHKVFFLLLGLFCLLTSGMAQPCFRVIDSQTGAEGEYEGCVDFSVKVQKCPGVNTPTYRFDLPLDLVQLPDGEIPESVPPGQIPADILTTTFFSMDTHTYHATGVYVIAQYVDFLTPIFLKKISVFDPSVKPAFTWELCGKKLKLTFTDEVFTRYSFSPGNGEPDEIIDGKSFEYTYSSVAGSPFTISVKGIKPSTCNKDAVSASISLYEEPRAPLPVLMEGIGTDTLAYKLQIGVRADEAYGFQQAVGTADFSGLLAAGREDELNPSLSLQLPLLDGNGLYNSRFRPVTKKCYSGTDQILPSPNHWTIFWPRCQSENQKITIRWPSLSIPGLVKFQLLRDGQVLIQPDPASGQFIDSSGLVCGSTYSYRFRTEVSLPGGAVMTFISAEVNASAISSRPPDPVQHITATVQGSGIKINARANPIASLYHLFRKEREGSNFAEIGSGFTTLPILDETARTSEKAYCYRISFDDVCGNRSLSSTDICPVFLSLSPEEGGSVSFDWTSMDGWDGGVLRYELVRKTSGKPDHLSYQGKDLSFIQQGQVKDSKRLLFRIRSIPAASSMYPDTSFSNEVEIIQESRFRFPDSFTPNNDGINDGFRCYGSFIKTYQLIIYNSWGNVVFSTDKPESAWDGKIDGQAAQTGNYAYRAFATDEFGEKMEKSGFFSLLR